MQIRIVIKSDNEHNRRAGNIKFLERNSIYKIKKFNQKLSRGWQICINLSFILGDECGFGEFLINIDSPNRGDSNNAVVAVV